MKSPSRDVGLQTIPRWLMWPADADPSAVAAEAAEYAAAGADLVILSMCAPYRVDRLEPVATALGQIGS